MRRLWRDKLQTISNRSNRILRIGIVAPSGAQALDFMGPIDAFHEANRSSESASRYEVDLIGVRAGPIVSSSGTRLLPDKVIGSDLNLYDTILVAGSLDYQTTLCEQGLVDWLATAAPLARRVGSISNGAFVLAAAGLLDGRRAATHWQAAKQLSAMFPKIRVEPDCLFVRDGPVYTAAGVTAGIDLCLHLIESDCGHATSLDVARMMVIFLRRSGGQPQISAFLKAQSASNTKIADAMEWALENLHADLSVDELAKRAAMSPRNFSRAFQFELRMTPGRYIEQVRVEAARLLLETTSLSIQQIAYHTGFIIPGNMRRAFVRVLQISPGDFRQRSRSQSAIDASQQKAMLGI
jgi:transcriptional regulator GlxA family with amidase domain